MTTSKGLGISIKYGDHSREMELCVTSILAVSACHRAITCAWHCCGSNRVTSGLPTTIRESKTKRTDVP